MQYEWPRYKPWPRGYRPLSLRQVREERRAAASTAATCAWVGLVFLLVVAVDWQSIFPPPAVITPEWIQEEIHHEVERTAPPCTSPAEKRRQEERVRSNLARRTTSR